MPLRLQDEVTLRCPAGNASDAEKRTLFQDCRASLHTAAVHLSQEAEAQISLLGIMADMQQVGSAAPAFASLVKLPPSTLYIAACRSLCYVLCCWTCSFYNVCMPLPQQLLVVIWPCRDSHR